MSEIKSEIKSYDDMVTALASCKSLRVTVGSLTENPKNELWHIRGIVDNRYVVCRRWTGKSWLYWMDRISYLWLLFKDGTLQVQP
jgi:hypothetical protein